MEKYNYLEAVTNDVLHYLNENAEQYISVADADELAERLNDDLWTVDAVTGNGSGSYTFDAYTAEEYLCHNTDLLQEACEEFGCAPQLNNAEWCDVTIRCYLLPHAIQKVLDRWTVTEEA